MIELAYMRMESPLGELLIACSHSTLQVLDYLDYEDRMHQLLHRRYGTTYRLVEVHNPLDMRQRMQAYFAGDLHAIDDVPSGDRWDTISTARMGGTSYDSGWASCYLWHSSNTHWATDSQPRSRAYQWT